MVNGLYSASIGMSHILMKQDVTANNLANANSAGFKTSRLVTRAEVTVARDAEGLLRQDERQSLAEAYNFAPGPLIQTGNPLDLAIAGDGYFAAEVNGETLYSRGGSLTLNMEGELVTLAGHKMLDDTGGAITVRGKTVSVQADGGVFVDGRQAGKLQRVDFKQPRLLVSRGDGFLSNPAGDANINREVTGELKQGFLEGSNVDVVGSMVSMISYFRNYEADQKVVRAIDETLGKAVNEIGRV